MSVGYNETVGFSFSMALTSAISLHANAYDEQGEVQFSLFNRVCAAIAFPLIPVVALVEIVVAVVLLLPALALCLCDQDELADSLGRRALTSGFAILWSVSNFFINFNVCNFTGFEHDPDKLLEILGSGSLMFTRQVSSV